MNKLRQFWACLRASFWFVPSVIVAASIAIAVTLVEVDSTLSGEGLIRWPLLFGVNAAGARGMLSTIAGSMMTVVGLTFSMTLVTLALASGQYTSRILRTFMRDPVTQVVLGAFAGIFAYSLTVLRTIRGGEDGFVPSLAVMFSVLLAIGGIGVLIFFIHHISSGIQASIIIASVADETMLAVDRLFPEELEQRLVDGDWCQSPSSLPVGGWQVVRARRDGYIQSVDHAALVNLARQHESVVRMERGIGQFVVRDSALVSVSLKDPPGEKIVTAMLAAYSVKRTRTVEQDVAFGIRQIVDIALRALSPSTNDTTTSIMCVDYLTAILARLVSRAIPSPYRFDQGELRLITIGPTFPDLVTEAFDQIRGSAEGNVVVMIRIVDALQSIATLTADPGRRQTLREQAELIAELAGRTIAAPNDRMRFENRMGRAREAFETEPAATRGEEPARALV